MGESTTGLLAHGAGDNIKVLGELPIESSLGFFYEAACRYAGLSKNDAGKFMGWPRTVIR